MLVTDVVMPKMNGVAVARALTQKRPGLKVLYMSGYTENAVVHHGVLDPGIRYLQKPFMPAELIRKVRGILDNK
jgi:two-component system, cell cycle sensor histidine kinase and response regulator CckA